MPVRKLIRLDMRRRTQAHSDDEKPKVPDDSAEKETDHPGAGQDLSG